MVTEKDYQSLFQRLSDAWPGRVECERVSDLGCRVTFEGDGYAFEKVACELRYLELAGRRFVQVLQDGDDGPPILVSEVTSAVVAVCTR